MVSEHVAVISSLYSAASARGRPRRVSVGHRIASAARIIRSTGLSLGFLTVRWTTLSSWRRSRSTSRWPSPPEPEREQTQNEAQVVVEAGKNHERTGLVTQGLARAAA